jgi:hypothetical protein
VLDYEFTDRSEGQHVVFLRDVGHVAREVALFASPTYSAFATFETNKLIGGFGSSNFSG